MRGTVSCKAHAERPNFGEGKPLIEAGMQAIIAEKQVRVDLARRRRRLL